MADFIRFDRISAGAGIRDGLQNMTRPRKTASVCPVCLKQIPALRMYENGEWVMRKSCPEHGPFRTVIWRGSEDINRWTGVRPETGAEEGLSCPGCGTEGRCGKHLQGMCCTVLEVTRRCNLNCRFCFADGGAGETADPPLEAVKRMIDDIVEKTGGTLLQLSGGEPTLRDDLPEIVAYARNAGIDYVQLNTNGIRLAQDFKYLHDLFHAGLNIVFLQFDGLTDTVYEKLRGRKLLKIKEKAIRMVSEHRIGVVLVPTLVPGVNTDQIGALISYGMSRTPYIKGIHFQPVSWFGRVPEPPADEMRYTLGELIDDIVRQTSGAIPRESLVPSRCDHPLCGLHGDYIARPDGIIQCLSDRSRKQEGSCCCGPDSGAAEKNREYIGSRWIRSDEWDSFYHEEPEDPESFEGFLELKSIHGFTITSMDFQDAGDLDLERLRQCSLHVYRDGKMIPFCAAYLNAFPHT